MSKHGFGYYATEANEYTIPLDDIDDGRSDTDAKTLGSVLTQLSEEVDWDDAVDYATMSSYLGDYVFTIPNSYDIHPKFTRYVVLFGLSTFVLRPSCCLIFLFYAIYAQDNRFLILGTTITAFFYGTLMLEMYYMYANIKYNLMPLSKFQQVLIGALSMLGPIIFVAISYNMIFKDVTFMKKILAFDTNLKTSGFVIYLVMIASLAYSITSISDAIGFLLPRLWTRAVLKSCVPF
ncbi:UL20 [Gallid alphaherpesvirus 2]|nr:UL20 [Gallid alphaherpesvirus 2]UOW64482.1 UL20 [Gallid alphaherpesvirus 2]UOW65653.1 UL20 [Gallid alphaherpesvirus 2]